MNISKYIGKTFPAEKTAKELGIDTSRKFVVVKDDHPRFEVGTVLRFLAKEESTWPIFVTDDESKHMRAVALYYLAYLEEEDDEKGDEANRIKNFRVHDKPLSLDEHKKVWLDGKSTTSEGRTVGVDDEKNYVPCEGDRVVLQGVIDFINKDNLVANFLRSDGEVFSLVLSPREQTFLTLISRKPRTLTKEEAAKLLSEKLGESVKIE